MFSHPERSVPFEAGDFPCRIVSFCEYQRAFARGKLLYRPAPAEFIGAFNAAFPLIARRWKQDRADPYAATLWESLSHDLPMPNGMSAEHRLGVRIMSLGAKGLDDQVEWAIWHDYYLRGATLVRLSYDAYISPAQLGRRVKTFPQKITNHLMGLEVDLLLHGTSDKAATYDRLMISRIEREFPALTRLHAETLWFFLRNRNHEMPPQEKAAGLGIGVDAMKKRIRKIIRPLHCANMDEAVALAVRHLHLEDTDPE